MVINQGGDRNLTLNDKLLMLENSQNPFAQPSIGSIDARVPSAKSRLSNTTSKRSIGSAVRRGKPRVASPVRKAQHAVQQAKQYEEKMHNRVNYLAKEEQKFLKKIIHARSDATKK